jgi:dihydroorotase-like cyclic amidohydrolase
VNGQEEKDFGSTFGGSGLPFSQRREMYLNRHGGMISYHNDQPRDGENIEEFRNRINPPDYMLHSLYFDGETVLACQRETLGLAKEANLKRLTTRHIPTGPALDMLLQARNEMQTELVAEVGLDYMYWNRDMLASSETRYVNYRRPAHPSKEDQLSLIELTRECAQKRDVLTFFGSDHAPHALAAKAFKNGLPGSPGTRVLELTHQIHMHLMQHHGFTHAEIDWLSAIAPAMYLSHYMKFDLPVGTMQNGAMANLVVFDPHKKYSVDEIQLKNFLEDKEYHSAYRGEELFGEVLFTVVDGRVYDVNDGIKALN